MKKIYTLLICALLVFVWGCDERREISTQDMVDLYFLNADSSRFSVEQRPAPEEGDRLEFAITQLLKGPESAENKGAVPGGTRCLGIAVNKGVATINLSAEFNAGNVSDKLWGRSAIISTACSVKGIDKVQILVEGEMLTSNSTGEPIGPMGKEDLVLNPPVPDTVVFTLYFADEEAMYLIPESRQVSIKEGESSSKVIVEELIKGPKNEALNGLLAPEIKVLSTDVQDKVCFVNFSPEFISRASGGSTWETLAVYSIVNSLCERDNIEKVQILVEGRKFEGFGHMDLSEPLERNVGMLRGGAANSNSH